MSASQLKQIAREELNKLRVSEEYPGIKIISVRQHRLKIALPLSELLSNSDNGQEKVILMHRISSLGQAVARASPKLQVGQGELLEMDHNYFQFHHYQTPGPDDTIWISGDARKMDNGGWHLTVMVQAVRKEGEDPVRIGFGFSSLTPPANANERPTTGAPPPVVQQLSSTAAANPDPPSAANATPQKPPVDDSQSSTTSEVQAVHKYMYVAVRSKAPKEHAELNEKLLEIGVVPNDVTFKKLPVATTEKSYIFFFNVYSEDEDRKVSGLKTDHFWYNNYHPECLKRCRSFFAQSLSMDKFIKAIFISHKIMANTPSPIPRDLMGLLNDEASFTQAIKRKKTVDTVWAVLSVESRYLFTALKRQALGK